MIASGSSASTASGPGPGATPGATSVGPSSPASASRQAASPASGSCAGEPGEVVPEGPGGLETGGVAAGVVGEGEFLVEDGE